MAKFVSETVNDSDMQQLLLYLPWPNTDRIISVYLMLSKVAKTSMEDQALSY